MTDSKIVVPENVPEDKKELVRERIAASREKYSKSQELRQIESEKRRSFKAMVHEGSKYFDRNKGDIKSSKFTYEEFEISVVVKRTRILDADTVNCMFSYAIKAPTDTWKDHIGLGLCCYRLKHRTQWTNYMFIPVATWECGRNLAIEAAEHIIKSRIIMQKPEIPKRMRNSLFKAVDKEYKNKELIDNLSAKAMLCIELRDYTTLVEHMNKLVGLMNLSDPQRKYLEVTIDAMKTKRDEEAKKTELPSLFNMETKIDA